MKQINSMTLAFILLISSIFISCSNDNNDYVNENVTNQELKGFFYSKEYKDFSTTFDLDEKNFVLEEQIVEYYKGKNVTSFIIPINRDGEKIGQILILSKNNGSVYRILYEDRTELCNSNEGIIKITTAKNKFVASLNCIKLDNQRLSIKIREVASVGKVAKTRVEFPSSEDGWLECTTRCYKIAKEACGDDAQCDFLCDIANLTSGCTITMALACSIYCL